MIGYEKFFARKLASPSVAYSIFDSKYDTVLIDKYGYLIPSSLEKDIDFKDAEKIFFAERYGGFGLSNHGGGVRCGFDGQYQVKGIGQNQLVGEDPDGDRFWHSHGGVALSHAIQETIWGEIFHKVLPYGAVRVPAIIKTGTECWFSLKGQRGKAARALVVREMAVRPAHFERAIFFRPNPGVHLVSDAQRVRTAVKSLPYVLPMPDSISAGDDLTNFERLKQGLFEMARRFAVQCAYAQSKRLMHGAMNASNISIDGRWLDYGTATALPNYANTRSYGLSAHLPTFWEEQNRLIPVLTSLCFYANKYYPFEASEKLDASELIHAFVEFYKRELMLAFLSLAGFPQRLHDAHIANPRLRKLGALLFRVAQTGVEKRIIPGVQDLSVFGENSLGKVLLILAVWSQSPCCDERISSYVRDRELRLELIEDYIYVSALFQHSARQHGIAEESFRRLCAFNALKVTKSITSLYLFNMESENMNLVKNFCDTEELRSNIKNRIQTLSDQAVVLYCANRDFQGLVWKDSATELFYDAFDNNWKVKRGEHIKHYDFTNNDTPDLKKMFQFYGEDLLVSLISQLS